MNNIDKIIKVKHKIPAIYKITSPTGKIYIGQSCNLRRRFLDYKYLRIKKSGKLYNSINKYGFKNHIFEILNICTEDELDYLEINYIKMYNSTSPVSGLNILKGGKGFKHHSKESLENLSNINKGKKMSIESRIKMSKKRLGKPSWNKGLKGVCKAWNKGLKCTKEHIDNMKKAKLGKKLTQEHKDKIGASSKGRIVSNETRKKISISSKGRVFSDESRKKMSESYHKYRQLQLSEIKDKKD